jgi:hypothetical protein
MKYILVLLVFFQIGYCGVLLVNDSPFLLVAEVQGANGIMLNQVNIAPGQQTNWTQDLTATPLNVPADASVSLTPYIVLWKCANGGFFSSCSNVSPGSLVKASLCEGAHYCKPKEDQQQDSCPPCVCPESDQNKSTSSSN